MNVRDLNNEQLTMLKYNYYCQNNLNVSYGELADIDSLVSDEEIFEEYQNTMFVEEDFNSEV
jgi:hypothetical protein